VTVNVRDHDTSANFEGAPLSAVLAAAGIALEWFPLRQPKLHLPYGALQALAITL
jgi:hypothetical protein